MHNDNIFLTKISADQIVSLFRVILFFDRNLNSQAVIIYGIIRRRLIAYHQIPYSLLLENHVHELLHKYDHVCIFMFSDSDSNDRNTSKYDAMIEHRWQHYSNYFPSLSLVHVFHSCDQHYDHNTNFRAEEISYHLTVCTEDSVMKLCVLPLINFHSPIRKCKTLSMEAMSVENYYPLSAVSFSLFKMYHHIVEVLHSISEGKEICFKDYVITAYGLEYTLIRDALCLELYSTLRQSSIDLYYYAAQIIPDKALLLLALESYDRQDTLMASAYCLAAKSHNEITTNSYWNTINKICASTISPVDVRARVIIGANNAYRALQTYNYTG